MVQTDISQLSAECADWRQILRNYREEFHNFEKALQQSCNKSLNKQDLLEVEHFQNQIDIQLKNIHDLKQKIKSHERRIQPAPSGEHIGETEYSQHEMLLNEFLGLENTLQEIRTEFRDFINKVSC